MENVFALLGVNCRDCMDYLAQALNPPHPDSHSLLLLSKAARERGLRFTYVTVNGHQVGAPVGGLMCDGHGLKSRTPFNDKCNLS